MAGDSPRGDEAALVVPHAGDSGELMLPRPLSPQDAAVLRRVFALQAHGDVAASLRCYSTVNSPILLGTVEADRYLGRSHRATVAELAKWLEQFHDLPDAPAIRALLGSKLPRGAAAALPAANPLRPETYTGSERVADHASRDSLLYRTVIARAASGSAGLALRQLAARKDLAPAYKALLRSEVAQQLFLRNENRAALDLAQSVLTKTPAADQPALAFYVGGLAAWRLDRFDFARTLFEGGASSANATPRLRAASAFWASRASRPLLDAASTVHWLRVAAAEPLEFHGLLARRILRIDNETIAQRQVITQADVDAVAATAGGQRALALLQIGQHERAEWELRGLWPAARTNSVFGRSLMLFASFVGMRDLAAQIADLLGSPAGPGSMLPRFPLPRLRPAGGFRLDPPLVYALARVESNFNPGAVSAMGARGLMQIMPETAQFITGNLAMSATALHEPAANLAIGQRYLALLSNVDGIGDNLLRILASYNAGPGNMLRWLQAMHFDDDPLLFIETIPAAETRAFVPEALTYAWLYAAQMHMPSPSLEAVAGGAFPRFTAESEESKMAAR